MSKPALRTRFPRSQIFAGRPFAAAPTTISTLAVEAIFEASQIAGILHGDDFG